MENIGWVIDAANSTYSTFTPGACGAHYTYLPTLPAGYTVADGVALPQVTVQVSSEGVSLSMARMAPSPATYDSWLAATAGGVTPGVGDTININGVVATYQGDISTSGLQTTNADTKLDGTSEIYLAGTGYVLLTWPNAPGAAGLTMHDAVINNTAAGIAGISVFSPLNVTLEGDNFITTGGVGLRSNNSAPALTIGGSGKLTVNAGLYALDVLYHGDTADLLAIQDSVNLTLNSQVGVRAGDIVVKGSSTVDITGTQYAATSNHSLTVADTARVTAKGETPFIVALDGISVGSGATLNGIHEKANGFNLDNIVYGTVTVAQSTTLNLSSAFSVTAQPGAAIINDGTLNLPAGFTYAQLTALHVTGSGTLQVGGMAVVATNGKLYADGGTLGRVLNLTSAPDKETYYKLNSGTQECYIIFTPAQSGKTAVLTLYDVNNAGYLTDGITLPNEPVTMQVVGKNYFFNINASNNLTISGDGLLESKIMNTNGAAVVTVNSGVTLNARYQTEIDGVTFYTIYGTYSGGVQIDPDEKLVLTPGAVFTVSFQNSLMLRQGTTFANLVLGQGAAIINNGLVVVPQGTTAAQIVALHLTGTGAVVVPLSYDDEGDPLTYNTYNNNGVALKMVGVGTGLNLTAGDYAGKTVEKDGFAWDSSSGTLTLGNAMIVGNITLPANATAIVTNGPTIVFGGIRTPEGQALNVAFRGTAPLKVGTGMFSFVDSHITVEGGAQVEFGGDIYLGCQGNSVIDVTGQGTSLVVSCDEGPAIYCDRLNVQNGASVVANGGIVGVDATAGINVTGGSSLTTNCEYGIYLRDGKLNVDDTSKLVTHGTIAPLCIVDTTFKKTQSEVLALPCMPDGAQVAMVKGTKANYWSIIPVNGSLGLAGEGDTAQLTGAKTGLLTFAKATADTGAGTGTTTVVVSTAGSANSKTVKKPYHNTSSTTSNTSSSESTGASSSVAQTNSASSSSAASTPQNSQTQLVEKQLSTTWLIILIILLIAAVTVGYLIYRRKKRQ